ncbi:MAG: ATP-binding protein [Catenulispora sp.]
MADEHTADNPEPESDPPGEDVLDSLAAIANQAGAEVEAQFQKLDTPPKSSTSTGGDGKDKGPSQATRLVELANAGFRTVAGADGKTYAVALTGPRIALPLRGENGLRLHLASAYYAETGSAAGSSALADALTVLEGQAMTTTPEPIALRVARHENTLVLDLGHADGRCIVISPGEWHLEPESPVLFRRTRLTSPIPLPSRTPGGLAKLHELLNVSDSGFRLMVAWLVASMFPDIAHPILTIAGEQGTAKSTCGRLLVSLVDDSPAPLRTPPKDAGSWPAQAAASWTVMLDNISTIAPWMSDLLCKAVTGDGMVTRALYTDDDVNILSFRRVLGMTTIDAGALRGDLAERILLTELDPIPADKRRTEEEVNTIFEQIRPAVLGAMLDQTAAVLAALPEVKVAELPRLADFARILAALDHVNKADGWTTLDDYTTLAAELTEAVIEADPFADAVRGFIGKNGNWTGTAGQLHELLTPDSPPKGWPASPRGVSGQLRRVAPALRKNGIDTSFAKSGPRLIHLTRLK